MKKINFRSFLYIALTAGLLVGCADEPELPPYGQISFTEGFEEGADNTLLVTEGWTNYAEQGTAKWKIQRFNDNGYAEYSSFQTSAAVSIGWLVSPAIVLEENHSKRLRFAVSQSFVSSPLNKMQVYVSSDFDGTNVMDATWVEVTANIPGPDAEYFEFQDSGNIDLSAFSGNVYVAFKVTGSGSNADLDGSYQVDNVTIY